MRRLAKPMEPDLIPPHLSAEEHSIRQAEQQLLKDGGQWLKRAADLYTQTPKIKIWVPVLCSLLITSYYLYSMHARSAQFHAPSLSAEPAPPVAPPAAVVVDDSPGPRKTITSASSEPSGTVADTAAGVSMATSENASDAELLQQAQQAHGSQQFADEAKLLQRVFDRSPSSRGVCPEIGKAYERAGEIDPAIRSFEHCISLAPDNVDTLIAFAHTLVAKPDLRRASALYRQCMQKDAENLDARTGMALIELKQNHLHEADQLSLGILHRAPGNTDALLITGIVAWRQARLNDAEEIFSKGTSLDNHRADFHAFLGRIAEAQRRPELALQEYEKALALDPADGDVADRRDRLRGPR